MRQIKFRAWDKVHNKFITEFIMYYDRIYRDICEFEENIYSTDIDLTEYTGLKDDTKWEDLDKDEQSNFLMFHSSEQWDGREIYEGDVVKAIYAPSTLNLTVIGVVSKNKWNNWILKTNREFHIEIVLKGQVIGNIYENPELLEGK